ncbi:MAG: hypothetical protein R2719_02840 [Micropruina sp.]
MHSSDDRTLAPAVSRALAWVVPILLWLYYLTRCWSRRGSASYPSC